MNSAISTRGAVPGVDHLHPATAHWGYPDPSEVEGSAEEKQAAFRKTMLAMRHRVELLTNLPAASIDKLAIQQSARDLAKR